MACLFVDVNPSKAKLTVFDDGNSFLLARTGCACCLWEMFLSVMAEGSTKSRRNGWSDYRSSKFDVAFYLTWAERNDNLM